MTRLSRRRLIQGLGLASLGVVATTRGTRTAMAVSGWEDTQLSYESSDGTLPSIQLSAGDLSFEFAYSNFPSGPTTVDVDLQARSTSHDYGTVLSGTFSVDGESDTLSVDGENLDDVAFPVDLLAQESISQSDFTAETGKTQESDIDLRVVFSAADTTTMVETTCTIKVTNTSSVIPDSGLAHNYDWSASGVTTSTIPDQEGTADLTGTFTDLQASINGVQAGTFDGVDDMMDVDYADISEPYEVFAVATLRTPNSSDYEFLLDGYTRGEHRFGYRPTGVWQLWQGGNVIDGNSADSNPHIFDLVLRSGTDEVRIDSVQNLSGDAGNSITSGLTVGSSGSGDYNGHYDVGQILVYNDELSTTERSDVESYLSDKWGITV